MSATCASDAAAVANSTVVGTIATGVADTSDAGPATTGLPLSGMIWKSYSVPFVRPVTLKFSPAVVVPVGAPATAVAVVHADVPEIRYWMRYPDGAAPPPGGADQLNATFAFPGVATRPLMAPSGPATTVEDAPKPTSVNAVTRK